MRGATWLLSLTIALSATAQDLGIEDAGRAALGRCYAGCMETLYRFGQEFVTQQERLFGLALQLADATLWSAEARDLESLLEHLQDGVCLTAQNYVRLGDACQAGCQDLERAYGVRTSNARHRFLADFGRDKDILEEFGLWTDYRTSPAVGSADFDAACRRFVGDEAPAAAAWSPATRTLRDLRAVGRDMLGARRSAPDARDE